MIAATSSPLPISPRGTNRSTGRGIAMSPMNRLLRSTAFAWVVLLIAPMGMTSTAFGGEVEVLHFWTSPGEAKSIAQLKELIAVRGHTWKDFAVVGGGGQNAQAVLKQRVADGRPPAAAAIKGPAIQEWAATRVLANLDTMATFEHWDEVLPPVIQDLVKYRGHYVAVPVNIHRVNWLWTNLQVLRKSGVEKEPSSFDDFLAAANKIKAAGYLPLAHGGQPWQDFVLFESVALGVGGVDFYKRAFLELDTAALAGPEMRRVLATFRHLKSYTDPKSRGREWNAATNMVIQGDAAFQFMGDWAKGEFAEAGRKPGKDFACTPAPGTAGAYSFVIDTFAMFQLRNWEAQKAQGYLAYVLLGPKFQEQFNLSKGSIPANKTVGLDKFDDCAKASRRDFDSTAKTRSLVPSVAVDMVLSNANHDALRAVVSDFWTVDAMSASDAIDRMLRIAVARPKSLAGPPGQ
jgi:glucose/mannose transport system substrate-binding protein